MEKTTFEVTLIVGDYENYGADDVSFTGRRLLALWEQGQLDELMNQLSEREESSEIHFSEIEEVRSALADAPVKRDKHGAVETGMQGVERLPMKPKDARRAIKILAMIDDKIEEICVEEGVEENDITELTLEMSAGLMKYFSTRMEEHLKWFEHAAIYRLDLYDKFVDLKAESEKYLKKSDEDDPDDYGNDDD